MVWGWFTLLLGLSAIAEGNYGTVNSYDAGKGVGFISAFDADNNPDNDGNIYYSVRFLKDALTKAGIDPVQLLWKCVYYELGGKGVGNTARLLRMAVPGNCVAPTTVRTTTVRTTTVATTTLAPTTVATTTLATTPAVEPTTTLAASTPNTVSENVTEFGPSIEATTLPTDDTALSLATKLAITKDLIKKKDAGKNASEVPTK